MIEDIKKTLWATADKLRANMDAAEYKHIVLGLIFVKYISDTFQTRRAELTGNFADSQDDYYLGDSAPELINAELEDRDYYSEASVLGARSRPLGSLARSAEQPDIGKRIDDALSLIEAENPKLKGILDKRYARAQLPRLRATRLPMLRICVLRWRTSWLRLRSRSRTARCSRG